MDELTEYSELEIRKMKGLFLFLFKHIENLTHENCVVNVNAFLYAAYNIEKDYNYNAMQIAHIDKLKNHTPFRQLSFVDAIIPSYINVDFIEILENAPR